MLLYYTQLHVKESFTSEELIKMFIHWMQNTKNRMYHFHYDNSLNYLLEDNHKRFEIKDFEDNHILGIQFITDQNYKKNQFTVEVLYSYKQKTIDLAFYKEITNDSKYIPKLSIPKIFHDIFKNENILKDNDLTIQKKPHFIFTKSLKNITSKHHDLPLIILHRKERCSINPVVLSQDIYGMAHVIVVNSQTEQKDIDIIYPNNEKEKITYVNNSTLKEVSRLIKNYMIQENQFYSFAELKRLQLLQTHQEITSSSHQIEEYFLEEIKTLKNEIQELQEIYDSEKMEYEKLLERNITLNQLVDQYNHDILISINKDNYKDYQELVLSIIHKNLKNLPPNEVYRRKDLLNSIERKQKL